MWTETVEEVIPLFKIKQFKYLMMKLVSRFSQLSLSNLETITINKYTPSTLSPYRDGRRHWFGDFITDLLI